MAEIDLYDLIPTESDDVVLDRMIADLPDAPDGNAYNARPGSVIYGLFQPLVVERARLMSYAREAFLQSFVAYATGQYLDQRATEAGVTRTGAQPAVVTLTISGTNGTTVPQGSQFATGGTSAEDSVVFSTSDSATIASGTATVQAFAVEPGVTGNVSAGTVSVIVLPIEGVTAVTNAADASGGADEQSDDLLRAAITERIQALASIGNAAYYRSFALGYADVNRASVDDLWDGNGTVMLSLSGVLVPYVSDTTVSEIQASLDPSIGIVASGSESGWSGGTQDTDSVEGHYSRTVSDSGTSSSLSLASSIDLSDLDTSDEIRLFVRDNGGAGSVTSLSVELQSGSSASNTATASMNQATLAGLAGISSRALAKFLVSDFTEAGSFDWSDVTDVVIEITTTGGAASLTFAGLRYVKTSGGVLNGSVPIGIQVTVANGRSRSVDVAATIEYADGVLESAMQSIIQSGIVTYLAAIPPGGVVRISEIANVIHDTRGVVDYTSVTIDSGSSNITLDANEGPVLGTLTITAI